VFPFARVFARKVKIARAAAVGYLALETMTVIQQ